MKSSIEFNKKKYELFKNAFSLKGGGKKELTTKTKNLINEHDNLQNSISISEQIIRYFFNFLSYSEIFSKYSKKKLKK